MGWSPPSRRPGWLIAEHVIPGSPLATAPGTGEVRKPPRVTKVHLVAGRSPPVHPGVPGRATDISPRRRKPAAATRCSAAATNGCSPGLISRQRDIAVTSSRFRRPVSPCRWILSRLTDWEISLDRVIAGAAAGASGRPGRGFVASGLAGRLRAPRPAGTARAVGLNTHRPRAERLGGRGRTLAAPRQVPPHDHAPAHRARPPRLVRHGQSPSRAPDHRRMAPLDRVRPRAVTSGPSPGGRMFVCLVSLGVGLHARGGSVRRR